MSMSGMNGGELEGIRSVRKEGIASRYIHTHVLADSSVAYIDWQDQSIIMTDAPLRVEEDVRINQTEYVHSI